MKQLPAKFLSFLLLVFCAWHLSCCAGPIATEPLPMWSVGFHEDPQSQLTISEAATLPETAFKDLNDRPLRLGFTASAVWLRVAIRNPQHTGREHWLELTSPLLEQINFFSHDAQEWKETSRQLAARKPVFKISTPANSDRLYYIRIKTRTSMSMQVNLWDPAVYMTQEAQSALNWTLMYGAYMSMAALFLVFWLWSKEPIHLIYSIYVVVNFMAAFMTEGWLLLALKTTKIFYIDALGILISLSIFIGTAFTLIYLETKKYLPGIYKIFLTITFCISIFCIITIIKGDYQTAVITAQISSIPIIFINYLIALHTIHKKSHQAKIFILAFTPFYVAVIWRYMRNINLIEPSFFNDNAYQFGAFFHMILMSLGIFASYTRLRHERNQAQAKANAEQSLREQQTDFMTMVSHETRTPLAVILASAENSLLDPKLTDKTKDRLNKIIKAGHRIQNLLTQFISRERNISASKQPRFTTNHLVRLAEGQVQEAQLLHSVKINLQKKSEEISFDFDAELIRIAMANLIENAIHHSQGTDSVDVEISLEKGQALITVSDRGPGFTEAELPQVLSRYYRGKNSKGFGLGLYLVNQIAQEHGGKLTITNRAENGCDVRLYLPALNHSGSDKPNITGEQIPHTTHGAYRQGL